MRSDNRRIREALCMAAEVLLILCAYLLSVSLRFGVMGGNAHLDFYSRGFMTLITAYAMAVVFAFYCLQMYKVNPRRTLSWEIQWVLIVNGIGVVLLTAFMFLQRQLDFSRLLFVVFWALCCGFIIAVRLIVRMLRSRSLSRHMRHVVVVGNGHLAAQYIQYIRENPQTGYVVDGYLSAHRKEELGRCLGSYEDLERILQETPVDEVIIALEPHETQFMQRIFAATDKEGVRVSLIPFFNDFYPSHPVIDNVGRTKLIDLRATPLDNLFAATFKRTFDIVASLALILLTSPIMLLTAVGVKLSSPGPILFKQERIGKDKKPFRMLKFRSMRVTGTEQTGWSRNQDPRKTRFGAFIRKFSIDELPQFFNVLCGDMSLIGPRPEVPYHVKTFREEIPRYLVRQQVRPGITGWAQVNGLRGDTSIRDRVKYDIYYIENWSPLLDLRILFKTAFGGMINQEQLTTGGDEKP